MKTVYQLSAALLIVFTLGLATIGNLSAQNVGVSSSATYNPYDGAILDLDGTGGSGGLLIPRIDGVERTALTNSFSVLPNTLSGAEGMMIYNEDVDRYEMFSYISGNVTNPANWEWRRVLNSADGGGTYILNQFSTDQTADFWIDGQGKIDEQLEVGTTLDVGTSADIGTTLDVGTTATIGTHTWIGGGIKVGSVTATPAPSNGNILMALDDAWIGSGSAATDVRLFFDQTSPEARLKVEQGSIPNVGHVALTIENAGASSGVGMKFSGNRGLAPGVGATREAGFIDFENTDGTTATLARVGVTNASGANTQGSFHISLQSTPTNALTERFVLEHNGDLTIDGKFESLGIKETSDERFKKNISSISNALASVMSLEGVTYNWRTEEFPNKSFTDRMEYGVIAQQIEKIVPELVDTDEEGFKSVQYSHMVPLLIEAIKEQQSIINSQSQEIGVLKASVEAISEHIKTAEK